jgi:hypothetical protein
MTKLPKELFGTGNQVTKRKYYFIDLNGEQNFVELDFGDKLSDKKCVLDGANIVVYSGDTHTISECPVCHEQFEGNEEYVKKRIENNFIPNTKEQIIRLKEKLSYLEKILSLAENSNNNIKEKNLNNEIYNKANLSAESNKETGVEDIGKRQNKSYLMKLRDIASDILDNNQKTP